MIRDESVTRTQEFDCPKCGLVTFTIRETPMFADGVREPVSMSFDGIDDYGQCQLAAKAVNPRRPMHGEIKDCPIRQTFPA
jgi:hypothetical protein